MHENTELTRYIIKSDHRATFNDLQTWTQLPTDILLHHRTRAMFSVLQ